MSMKKVRSTDELAGQQGRTENGGKIDVAQLKQ
jgi:hypothetical protein